MWNFSGVTLQPPGEEQLHKCIEQAQPMIKENDWSDREKRMKHIQVVKLSWFEDPAGHAI